MRGLEAAETGALLLTIAPHVETEDSVALIKAVQDETDGNPFFLLQTLQHYKESGVLQEASDGTWTAALEKVEQLGVPEGVREVLGRRLSRLSEAANQALSRASVIGRDFSSEVLEWTAGLDTEVLLDALDEACASGLVEQLRQPPSAYRFGHAIVREALYAELNTTRRVLYHREVGEALEELGAGEAL